MDNLAGVVRLLKKEQDRLTKELSVLPLRLSATHVERQQVLESFPRSSSPDRGCTKSALGESSGKRQGCSHRRQTHALGGCTQEDRRCTKGSLGEGEGGKENGIAGH
jgi:hypothetical protein